MKKIIFTVTNDLTSDQRMHRICNTLANNGYEVLLVGRKLKTSIPLRTQIFNQKRLHLFFTKGKLFYIEYNFRLFFFLLFQKTDALCGIDLDTILPCYFISKIKNKKIVYDAHELFSEVPEVVRRKGILKFWKKIEKYSICRIKNCYTVSESVADYFEKHYERKFTVIRNMPAKNQTFLPSEKSKSFLLYQGALNEGRGLEQLIEAMKQLDFKLVIAGEGDLSQLLRISVQQNNLDAKIEFAGKKTAAELFEITNKSYIGINFLENTSLNYYYSLANKFFDYASAGIPQITMNFPEYKKMNSEYEVAILIDDLETETIVEAVNRLLEEKDIYLRLKENCLRAREEWNWQKEEAKLISFYENLK
jgi:glycosyltransferase involved in cell wall biosynthesis